MKKFVLSLLTAALMFLGASAGSAGDAAPSSVIHIIQVAWKEGTTPEQIQAALDGVHALQKAYPGITRVWTKATKVQNAPGTQVPRTHVIVMEFASEQALKDYANSDAQKKWYEVYTPIRAQSTNCQVTN